METRRDFLKKGLYITPVILSVAVRSAYANHGYTQPGFPGQGNHFGWSSGHDDYGNGFANGHSKDK